MAEQMLQLTESQRVHGIYAHADTVHGVRVYTTIKDLLEDNDINGEYDVLASIDFLRAMPTLEDNAHAIARFDGSSEDAFEELCGNYTIRSI